MCSRDDRWLASRQAGWQASGQTPSVASPPLSFFLSLSLGKGAGWVCALLFGGGQITTGAPFPSPLLHACPLCARVCPSIHHRHHHHHTHEQSVGSSVKSKVLAEASEQIESALWRRFLLLREHEEVCGVLFFVMGCTSRAKTQSQKIA